MKFNSFDELIEKVVNSTTSKKPVAAVAGAEKDEVIKAVLEAIEIGALEAIFVGDTVKIRELMIKNGANPDEMDIRLCNTEMNPAETAVEIIKNGEASFLIKGSVETSELMRPVVKKENGLRTGRVISHVVFYKIPYYNKIFLLTDAGITAYPDLQRLKEIIENAVTVLKKIGYEKPKVAVVCCKETVDAHMPETLNAQALKQMSENGELKDCIVEGPISLDLALSAERAKIKKYDCPYSGDFDVIVVPNIHAGNLLGKSWELMPDSEQASVVVGAKIPIVLTSRAAPAKERLRSIILAGMLAD